MGEMAKFGHKQPHLVMIPYPAQGHVSPMLKLSKLLFSTGDFHITFVNTEYNHKRLLNSRGPSALDGLPGFRFCTIPDGMPPSTSTDVTQDIPSLTASISKNFLEPFCDMLSKIIASEDSPRVTCIISDGVMSFTLDAAHRFGLPEVLFWTPSACGFLGYTQYNSLMERGIIPLKDESYLTNGYLENVMEWIPGMKNIRLKDLPSFLRTTDPNDFLFNYLKREANRASMASAIIINTFQALEPQALDSLSSFLPPIYTIGPLHLMSKNLTLETIKSIGSNLWKEETDCFEWLDSKQPGSVVLVNFGSITVMSSDQMTEFAWGLANSKIHFLWVIRPDLVVGESSMLPPQFAEATKERGKLSSWCPQEQVLQHEAIGGFLTHSGWNSTLEAICGGVPVLCWPFFAEQQTNCRYSVVEWGIGMEIDSDVKREKVEKLVREMMEGEEKGKEMRRNAMEWKKKAEDAIAEPNGSSYINFQKLLKFIS